jgi:NitT/TauT family transport system substrate-binding protein
MKAVQASRPMYSRDGIVSPAGMKNAFNMLVEFDEELRTGKVDLAKTFDGRFVQKAASGK